MIDLPFACLSNADQLMMSALCSGFAKTQLKLKFGPHASNFRETNFF
jgi:hypothetical protein